MLQYDIEKGAMLQANGTNGVGITNSVADECQTGMICTKITYYMMNPIGSKCSHVTVRVARCRDDYRRGLEGLNGGRREGRVEWS